MNTRELNKWIHEEIMGLCWHEAIRLAEWSGQSNCKHCRAELKVYPSTGLKNSETLRQLEDLQNNLPDYCYSLDLMAGVETKVIEKVGDRLYAQSLIDVLTIQPPYDLWDVAYLIRTTALQRAMACQKAMKGKDEA